MSLGFYKRRVLGIGFKRPLSFNEINFWETDGYYFFDPQSLTAGAVTSWDGSLNDSTNNLGLVAAQATAEDQPVADGVEKVTFADVTDALDITSTTQAGWQIVGTSLGTFAYKVDSDPITELNLLGNLGRTADREEGDLYGIILLPDTATPAQVEAARQLLISRGAADGVIGTSTYSFWRERADIVEFGLVDTLNVNDFIYSWRDCSSLTSFPLIDTSNALYLSYTWQNCTSLKSFPLIVTSKALYFRYSWGGCTSLESFPFIDTSKAIFLGNAWDGCTSLTSFPAGMFDSWNPTSIADSVFNSTWDGCSSLTPQSVENILVSIATSGKYATTSGASGGTALTDPEIDIDYDGTGLTSATETAINTLIERGWRVKINGVLVMPFIEQEGYYFFDAESLTAGNVTSWDGGLDDSPNDLGLVAAQATSVSQPTAIDDVTTDGTSVTFDTTTEYLDITSTTQAGWQIVGTSLGTFAYKVDSDTIAELNLLGNLGSTAYRKEGDLYGIILLPATATPAQVEAARQLLISRGAANTTTDNVSDFWRQRNDIVEFKGFDATGLDNLSGTWRQCQDLKSVGTIDTSSARYFSVTFGYCDLLESFSFTDCSKGETFKLCWVFCYSLEDFPPNFFDNWNPTTINNEVFDRSWRGCSSLTPQSVENILVSIATSGKYATTSGASGGTALTYPEIGIDYDGTGLTTATNTAITTLKSRGWGIRINGTLQ